jgi:hypothetical protein
VLVKNLDNSVYGATLAWDCKNGQGTSVPAGIYILKAMNGLEQIDQEIIVTK